MQVNGAEETEMPYEMTEILWVKMRKGEVSVLIEKISNTRDRVVRMLAHHRPSASGFTVKQVATATKSVPCTYKVTSHCVQKFLFSFRHFLMNCDCRML